MAAVTNLAVEMNHALLRKSGVKLKRLGCGQKPLIPSPDRCFRSQRRGGKQMCIDISNAGS